MCLCLVWTVGALASCPLSLCPCHWTRAPELSAVQTDPRHPFDTRRQLGLVELMSIELILRSVVNEVTCLGVGCWPPSSVAVDSHRSSDPQTDRHRLLLLLHLQLTAANHVYISFVQSSRAAGLSCIEQLFSSRLFRTAALYCLNRKQEAQLSLG